MAGSVVSMGVVAIGDKDRYQVTAWSPACTEYLCGSDVTQNHRFTVDILRSALSQTSATSWVGLSRVEGIFLPKTGRLCHLRLSSHPCLTLPERG